MGRRPRSIACSGDRGESASARSPTATDSTSTIWRCGCSRSSGWEPIVPRYQEKADRARARRSIRLRHPRGRRHLEDARRPERALSGLRPRRAGRISRAGRLSPARPDRPGAGNRRDEGARRSELSAAARHAGSGPGHDPLDDRTSFRDEPWARDSAPAGARQLDRMWIDPPGYFCREPGAARRQVRVHQLRRLDRPAGRAARKPSASSDSIDSSTTIARATNTTRTPSRTSWGVPRIFRDAFSIRSERWASRSLRHGAAAARRHRPPRSPGGWRSRPDARRRVARTATSAYRWPSPDRRPASSPPVRPADCDR